MSSYTGIACAGRPLVPVSHDLFPPASTDPMGAGLGAVAALYALFTQVADLRDPRGVRHVLASVLKVLVFTALAGARTFRETGDRSLICRRRRWRRPVPGVIPAPGAGATEPGHDPPGRGGPRRPGR